MDDNKRCREDVKMSYIFLFLHIGIGSTCVWLLVEVISRMIL